MSRPHFTHFSIFCNCSSLHSQLIELKRKYQNKSKYFKYTCFPIIYLKGSNNQFPTTTDPSGNPLGHSVLGTQQWPLHDLAGRPDTGVLRGLDVILSLCSHSCPENRETPELTLGDRHRAECSVC